MNAIAGMELGWLHWRGGHMRQAETLLKQVLGGLESAAAVVDAPDIEWIRRFTLGGLVEVLTRSAGIAKRSASARRPCAWRKCLVTPPRLPERCVASARLTVVSETWPRPLRGG